MDVTLEWTFPNGAKTFIITSTHIVLVEKNNYQSNKNIITFIKLQFIKIQNPQSFNLLTQVFFHTKQQQGSRTQAKRQQIIEKRHNIENKDYRVKRNNQPTLSREERNTQDSWTFKYQKQKAEKFRSPTSKENKPFKKEFITRKTNLLRNKVSYLVDIRERRRSSVSEVMGYRQVQNESEQRDVFFKRRLGFSFPVTHFSSLN